MRALSVRQPFAELILSGRKTAEYRSRPTRLVGERFYLYAARKWGVERQESGGVAWSTDLALVAPPPWMLELAEGMRLWRPGELPTGLIVGTATLSHVTHDAANALYRWHLADVERLDVPLRPTRQPQPTWFEPFKERGEMGAGRRETRVASALPSHSSRRMSPAGAGRGTGR